MIRLENLEMGSSLDERMAAHMRLYYGWLKARYQKNPCDVYKGVCGADPQSEADLKRIEVSHTTIAAQVDQLNWSRYMQELEKCNPHAWKESVSITGAPQKLSSDEAAYYEAWLNPPTLSENLLHFFDTYVHDSRAGFQSAIGRGLYLSAHEVIKPSGVQPSETKPVAAEAAALSQP